MTTTITAFNKEISIHPEYYYNSTKITNNPQQAVDNVVMLFGITTALSITSILPCVFFINTMNNFIDIPFSAKNIALGTAASFTAITAITTTHKYFESGKELEEFVQDVQNLAHYQHDAALFSLEYAVDHAFEFMS